MNDLWYVLTHHWDDVCDDYADVKFSHRRKRPRIMQRNSVINSEPVTSPTTTESRFCLAQVTQHTVKHILKLMSIIPAVMHSLPAKSTKSVRCVYLYE